MEFSHKPVLLEPCLVDLNIQPSGIYVDGTTGGAGHSLEIAKRLQSGKLYAFDQDPDAVTVASKRLKDYHAVVLQDNFRNIKENLNARGVFQVDGILLDLGVSSFQLDNPQRGFSYLHNGKLDMRMSKSGLSAYDIVNQWPLEKLNRILRDYGEERYSRSIATNIVLAREKEPISTTKQLAQIIADSMPMKMRREKNPSKRSFQAIRIAVNGELESLQKGLCDGFSILKPGGRLAVITFHSIEDRMVKQYFAKLCQGCTCPPDFPICICGKTPKAKLIHKKPVTADSKELNENRRSRSAKLRTIEKIAY